MILVFKEDGGNTVSIQRDVESIHDYVWVCFNALLGIGCDPKNICDSFVEVAEEVRQAWELPETDAWTI